MDLVSAIIPFYKKTKYIHETVSSILKQTYENIEIVIVYDDLEKDDLNFLRKNFSDNNKIRIIVNDTNLGAGVSRNKGIEAAKGSYIGFIDADDLWSKEKISKQISFMKNNNLQVSHTSYEIINEEGTILSTRKSRHFDNYKNILTSCDIGLSSVLLKKELITKEIKFASLKTKEDFVLWLLVLKRGYKIGALKKNLTLWRKVDNSLSSSVLQKLIDGFRVYHIYMNFNRLKSIYFLLILSLTYLRK